MQRADPEEASGLAVAWERIVANLSLHHLIESIAGAVAAAQDKIQRFQISAVRQYFDDDNRPVSVDVRLPSLAHDAEEGDERLVRVPLLSLVGARLLAVKDLEISFDIGLGPMEDGPPAPPPSSPPAAADAAAAGLSASGQAAAAPPAAGQAAAGQAATDPSAGNDQGTATQWPAETHKPLSVDFGASRNRDGGPMARITLRVESQPSSEGMARLIHHLDKSI
ncbi:DUF2589 domain-containing protein [Ferrovibrio xuzhouensis]|uniref:DUF2589 domain-containing protein n=1 Tax=Ferrovibrio xuzhouensis TaxID=1576914 RepID=A0ABV7VGW2_9PROT